jgi:aryl-alcohol dehydrogenase-like predicted oxidoreductase
MKHRQLGKDGPQVPVVGLGAWPFGEGMGPMDEKAVTATVRGAIDRGITLIDTAESYRSSQERLGHALKDGYRQRCFLATKVSYDYSPEGITAAMEESLSKLQVDYVDLYQIHQWSAKYPIEASMETMARLQEEGKTRFIGVSNFDETQMAQAASIAPIHSLQTEYSMFQRRIEAEVVPHCQREGIGILPHSPLSKGLLSGRFRSDHVFPESDERTGRPRFQPGVFDRFLDVVERLKVVAADKDVSLVQLAIAWVMRLPEVTTVLVGAKSPQQAQEHLGSVDLELSPDDLKRIDEILQAAPDVHG